MGRDIAFAIEMRPHNVVGPRPCVVAGEEIHRQDKHSYAGDYELYGSVGAGSVVRSNPMSLVSTTKIYT